jgi:hypothetical protein
MLGSLGSFCLKRAEWDNHYSIDQDFVVVDCDFETTPGNIITFKPLTNGC